MPDAASTNGDGKIGDERDSHFPTRALAAILDYLIVAPWLGAVWAVSRKRGGAGDATTPVSTRRQARVFATSVTAPVTLGLAAAEASGGTPGKRLTGLAVVDIASERPSIEVALLRMLLRVALPWQLAHAGVIRLHAPSSRTQQVGKALLGASYAVMLADVFAAWKGLPTLPDRVTHTRVTSQRRPNPTARTPQPGVRMR